MKYYKFLTKNMTGTHTDYTYTLGEWTEPIKELEMCAKGYHVCDRDHLYEWIHERLFEVEIQGATVMSSEKLCCEQIRLVKELNWNEQTQRFSACEIAYSVLNLFEKQLPGDMRPRLSIIAALKFALGKIPREVMDAAYSAANSAAYSAAYSAANSAAYSAADSAAYYAAYSAANSAANSAADYAARSAAYYAARRTYSQIIADYAEGKKTEKHARKLLAELEAGLK